MAAGQVEKYKERFYTFTQYKANAPRSQSIEYMPCPEDDEPLPQTKTKFIRKARPLGEETADKKGLPTIEPSAINIEVMLSLMSG